MTWICTYSGRKVFPLDLTPEDICLTDIAHALAGKMRYSGHCWVSVAQHSVAVCKAAQVYAPKDRDLLRYALLHDAHEAYWPDMLAPLKLDPRMAWFNEEEDRVQKVVLGAMGVVHPGPSIVDGIDRIVCTVEARMGFKATHPDWAFKEVPQDIKGVLTNCYLVLREPARAEQDFLKSAKSLGLM